MAAAELASRPGGAPRGGGGGQGGQVRADRAAEMFPVTSGCEWRGLGSPREDSAILGFEPDPAKAQRLALGPLLLISPVSRKRLSGPVVLRLLPPFLSAGTKGPLLIELVGRLVWRSRISEVYLASLLIWEPECVISLPWAS